MSWLDRIGNVTTRTFAGLAAVEAMDLGGNSISRLPAGVFASLTSLRTLLVAENAIQAIQAGNTMADPGGDQGVQTPALLFRCPFSKRTFFENMSLRLLAEQGAS